MSYFQVFLFSRRPHVASLCASLSSSCYLCTLKRHGTFYNLRAIFQVDHLSWKIRSVAKRLICRYFSVRCISLSLRLPCVLITETLGLRSAEQKSKIVSAECWQDERILYGRRVTQVQTPLQSACRCVPGQDTSPQIAPVGIVHCIEYISRFG